MIPPILMYFVLVQNFIIKQTLFAQDDCQGKLSKTDCIVGNLLYEILAFKYVKYFRVAHGKI